MCVWGGNKITWPADYWYAARLEMIRTEGREDGFCWFINWQTGILVFQGEICVQLKTFWVICQSLCSAFDYFECLARKTYICIVYVGFDNISDGVVYIVYICLGESRRLFLGDTACRIWHMLFQITKEVVNVLLLTQFIALIGKKKRMM